MKKFKYLSKKYKFLIVLVIVLTIAIIGFLVSFYTTSGNRKEQGKDYSIGDLTMEITDSTDENRNLQEELKEINSNYVDAVAWLKIPGTSIDTVVFQCSDNEKYLRYDRNNNETRWGENFLDYDSKISNIPSLMQHIIVYGHNTEVDTRFSPLLNYKAKEFFENHKYIEFATLNGTYKFEIFATYKTTTDFYYIETEFENIEEYYTFITSLKSNSEYDTGVQLSSDDVILTLSTCDYSVDNGRYVVNAKLIKE